MRILRRSRDMIHTHFITDCSYLPQERGRQIKNQIEPLLRELGIVYGIHFRETPGEKGLTIVLECLPFPDALQRIEDRLAQIIKDIPSRPRKTTVTVEDAPRSRPAQRRRA